MKRILVVDDDELLRDLLAKGLELFGFEVETAPEGSSALKLYQRRPFDLVVTDLVMPGTEGLETILALRQIQPDLKIIAISGAGRERGQYLPMARQFGAAQTLIKPFALHDMLSSVKALLSEP